MPTNYTSRILLIAGVLLAALWSIFPGIFRGEMRPDLKPGIDMVGGTSLLYEIKSQDGGPTSGRLAEEVMSVLKKRVDPDGQRNLIWRPQGNERLEIQMPLTANSGESKQKRQAYADAQRQLEQTNVRSAQVLAAVETLSGDARRNRLNQLAAGSPRRDQVFGALASVWDQLQQAKKEQNAAVQADKEIEYAQLKAQIEETNVAAASLEQMLATPMGEKRVAELKEKFKDFPARLTALDAFVASHAEYQKVKGALDDASELKRLLQGSGVLEFHIIVEYDKLNPPPEVAEMVDRLQKRGPVAQAGDTMRWYQLDRPEEMADVAVQWNGQSWVLAYTDPSRALVNRAGQPQWELARAGAESDPSSGERVVSFQFDPQGADYFGDLTETNIGKRLGIVLDDRMISAPVINSRISSNGQITGNRADGGFTAKEQGYLVSMLRAGSLPARLTDEPIREQTVGPQIGADNLRAGLIACAFGLIVVAFFLIGYYYLAGVVAFCAVMLNMVIILGAMAALNATFTLPGVAGIVLTIGMAVDANVLIFERLREEQQRGLSLRMALRNAYDRAWSAILDGNVTTGITAAALYVFGSEEVKGFGLTLLIGIVASLFTALYVTKTIFGLLIDHGGVTKLGSLPLTFPNWDRMLRPNIDWMGKAKYFYAFSAVFIVVGLGAFFVKLAQGQMMDIEFASGTAVQFELQKPMKIEEVRRVLNEESERNRDGLPSPSIYAVENSETTYEVVTPTADAVKVREAVLHALGERLKLELPSQFKGLGQPFRDLLNNGQVVPIKTADQQVGGFAPPQLSSHLEGVAIVLADLDPPLKPSEVKARMERVRLQPVPGGSIQPYRETDVVNADGDDEPSKTLVVLVSDPAFEHKANELAWQQELAAPMWRLVSEGVGGEPSLQKVVNFDAQVAAETQREATIAMILSIVGIMAYIWLRFGNLKYGTATVVALAHDTLFTLAAIGIAHYLAPTFIGRALLIEPFRINLTMVAAVLTIIGYSMNDTVVIFDRIRENRGRYGAVSRRVINDSVNQTLSRTLLTGGTTILTIFVMYVWGGPGIHGFTYALLLGILVGTYSSIAIAAPILLVGGRGPEEGPREAKRESKEAEKPLEPVGQLQRA